MPSLEDLFCGVDDFCQAFEPSWNQRLLGHGLKMRKRPGRMSLSERMTIAIAFHLQGYRNFKTFYTEHVAVHWRSAFPNLVSYQRFVSGLPSLVLPLCAYLKSCFGQSSGIGFIDATCLKVCHNRRIRQHKVFKASAARGKTSVDWFYGFKLHLVVNDRGELLNMTLTPGNTDDRKPVKALLQGMFGKIFADKGYVSKKLALELLETCGVQFVAKPRRNMKNKLMCLGDKLLSRKRSIIETIIDQLKNISQIEHSRHRSPTNFSVNLLCGLIAYCHQPKKPALNLHFALSAPSA